jgi:hypothetical protein
MKQNTLFFSTEPGVYHGWQSALLVSSTKEHLDSSKWNIVRAIAVFPNASSITQTMRQTFAASGCEIHCHSNYAAELSSADCYSPYNKILALRSYLLEHCLPDEHQITIIDPDFIILKNYSPRDAGNSILAEQWAGLDPTSEFGQLLGEHLKLDSKNWQSTPSIGVPVTLSVRQLSLIIDDWLQFTIAIRQGFNNGTLSIAAIEAWCAEMWGFMAAVAHHELPVETSKVCNFCYDTDMSRSAFIHYCHAVNDNSGNILWDKRWYEPTAQVVFDSERAGSLSGKYLLERING